MMEGHEAEIFDDYFGTLKGNFQSALNYSLMSNCESIKLAFISATRKMYLSIWRRQKIIKK